MANGHVEMVVPEVSRQYRTLQMSAEQSTSVRIANNSPLLSCFPRFAAQVMNKVRMGKEGKSSELSRTGRRRRMPMAQFRGKVWFRNIGEDNPSSNRTTQLPITLARGLVLTSQASAFGTGGRSLASVWSSC